MQAFQRVDKKKCLYAYEISITINAKKSIFLVFKGRECEEANASICMCVNGDKIEKSECADHLGHRISTNDNESMCKSAIASFWMYFNMFMYDFGHTYSFVKSKLFQIKFQLLWCPSMVLILISSQRFMCCMA